MLTKTRWVHLTSSTNPSTGRKHYTITLVTPGIFNFSIVTVQEIRKLFDPAGNRGLKTGYTWKFRNRNEAEKLLTLAILTWGE